jgi:hypothetical protein
VAIKSIKGNDLGWIHYRNTGPGCAAVPKSPKRMWWMMVDPFFSRGFLSTRFW